MPELSRFYGIIIRIYMEAGGQHHQAALPRLLRRRRAIYALSPVELIAGSLPRRQQRFVEAWAELHEDELADAWQLLQNGQLPQPIAPL